MKGRSDPRTKLDNVSNCIFYTNSGALYGIRTHDFCDVVLGESHDNQILHSVQRKLKNSFPVKHTIPTPGCLAVFRGLVVIAVASEGRDTEFESHLVTSFYETVKSYAFAVRARPEKNYKVQKWSRLLHFVLRTK